MKIIIIILLLLYSVQSIWGPTCRSLCYNSKGSICGILSQSCCKEGYCANGWMGEECEIRLFIPGCTTNWSLF
ncbi:unnamed protein product [Paramecium octaurelia]|uniref:Uncharacterized protein n=1 Tax=Paramecium octaurelia TaxID=43137 RepID=A0A8S1Y1J4_PAROT|nr:unnamed protein product [Paramecium octaurelia]